jgi:hypothetical protein
MATWKKDHGWSFSKRLGGESQERHVRQPGRVGASITRSFDHGNKEFKGISRELLPGKFNETAGA